VQCGKGQPVGLLSPPLLKFYCKYIVCLGGRALRTMGSVVQTVPSKRDINGRDACTSMFARMALEQHCQAPAQCICLKSLRRDSEKREFPNSYVETCAANRECWLRIVTWRDSAACKKRAIGRHNSARRRSNLNRLDWLAGAGGFEPPHGGIKIRCLTTWLRPKTARDES
jgi:hypothetical protein